MKNPSTGSRVVPCGRTDKTKITRAFRIFDKVLEKEGGKKKDGMECQQHRRYKRKKISLSVERRHEKRYKFDLEQNP